MPLVNATFGLQGNLSVQEQLRLRRQVTEPGPVGPSTAPFGLPTADSNIQGLVNSVEAFGPIVPTGLFPSIQTGSSATVEANNRDIQDSRQFQQPTVGGPATALALARLAPSHASTSPLRANIRQA